MTNKSNMSPWGPIQHKTTIAEGIDFVSTASHGGLRLSDERLAKMPEAFKLNSYGKGRWFEEDCEFALVVLAFPDEFTGSQIFHARVIQNEFYKELTPLLDEVAQAMI